MVAGKKVYVIAEAGVNHNGSLERARKMVAAAARSGADAVKFQTFSASALVTKDAAKAAYQVEKEGPKTQYEMLKQLELSPDDHRELIQACAESGIEFLSTPFDLKSIELLAELGMKKWKIPSGEITNLPYLRAIAAVAETVILSTGMARLQEVKDAVQVLKMGGVLEHLNILHCTTAYPTPVEEVNLRALKTLEKEFPDTVVGYSDHTLGMEVAIAAVSMGARIIEKHFTLDKYLPGPDHKASALPDELSLMIRCIRNVEKAIGSGIKEPGLSEIKNLAAVRKSIVAVCNIQKGEVFSEKNIGVKRPGGGISPMEWDRVVGGIAKQNYKADEMIND